MQHTNTFDAHLVAKYASVKGKGKEMTERVLKAYFTDSELISDHKTLVKLSGEVGLDKDDVTAILKADDYAGDVRADEKEADNWVCRVFRSLFSMINMLYPEPS